MNRYQIGVVDPKTNEQRVIPVEVSAEHIALAYRSRCFDGYIANLLRPDIPDGFLLLGASLDPLPLH